MEKESQTEIQRSITRQIRSNLLNRENTLMKAIRESLGRGCPYSKDGEDPGEDLLVHYQGLRIIRKLGS
jgi:hypothetical protein